MKASLPYHYITAVKNGKQYVVFDYKDKSGKRKRKWVATGLSEKCSKKALAGKLTEIVEEFDVSFLQGTPDPAATKSPSTMKATDYFAYWLSAIRQDVARTTYQTYNSMFLEKKKLDAHNKIFYGKSYDNEFDGFVCRVSNGKLLAPDYVTNHFHYIIKKNDLRPLRFHDLRHSCASLLLANDIPMKAIQEWLGHSTFNITANLYSHLEYNAKVASAETLARVLGGEKERKPSDKDGLHTHASTV